MKASNQQSNKANNASIPKIVVISGRIDDDYAAMKDDRVE